jgi:hypothetical protein
MGGEMEGRGNERRRNKGHSRESGEIIGEGGIGFVQKVGAQESGEWEKDGEWDKGGEWEMDGQWEKDGGREKKGATRNRRVLKIKSGMRGN